MEDNSYPNSNTLSVKDLNVAAFLMASGQVKLVDVERHPNNTAYFHFEQKEVAESLVTEYWAETVSQQIQPKKILSSLRDLKDILFSGGQG